MDVHEQIDTFKDFLQAHYYSALLHASGQGHNYIKVDFALLSKFNPTLANMLLEQPEEVHRAFQHALELFDLDFKQKQIDTFKFRFFHLPTRERVLVKNLRSIHLNKFIYMEGTVRQKAGVKPKVVSATFECPSCGNVITKAQVEEKMQQPGRCAKCSFKGRFRILERDLVDSQGITIEEIATDLEGGEQPKRLKIYLQDDLVSPMTEKKTNPGAAVRITGVLKEIEKQAKDGGKLTTYDFLFEANNIEPMNEDITDVKITSAEKEQIEELSKDPHIRDKLVAALAPGIYGYENVKEAILLQFLGGVQKKRSDGVKNRGDIHILLIGDPGSGKCVSGDTLITLDNGDIRPIADIAQEYSNYNNNYTPSQIPLPSMQQNGKNNTGIASKVWKRQNTENLLQITTQTGKTITVTKNHPLFHMNQGVICAQEAQHYQINEFIAIPKKVNINTTLQIIPTFNQKHYANNTKQYTYPTIVTKPLGRLLGYLCGDGCTRYTKTSGTIQVTSKYIELLEDFKTLVQFIFNAEKYTQRQKQNQQAYDIIYTSKNIVDFFTKEFKEITTHANQKEIPQKILRSPNVVLAQFIKALFDCDAHVNPKKHQIEYTTTSKTLAQQLQLVLQRFGIVTLYKEKKKWATNTEHKRKITAYELIIPRSFCEIYQEHIDFTTLYKKDALAIICTKKQNTNINIVPNIGVFLKQLREELQVHQKDMGLTRTSYAHYEQQNRNPSVQHLQIIYNHLKHYNTQKIQQLQAIIESDFFWDKITKIQEVPAQTTVYDFEVDTTHNFIANGVVVHNSQLLKRASHIAPRGRYVSGKGTSGAGLTAAVVRDEFLGGWSLEGGALVLANRGVCVTGETEITLEKGRKVRIDTIQHLIKKEPIKALSFNEKTLKTSYQYIKNLQKRTSDHIIELQTSAHDIINITEEHPLPVWNNGLIWKTVKEIQEGEYIIDFREQTPNMAKKVYYSNSENTPIPISEAYAELLGLLLTDGHLRKQKYCVAFYTKSHEQAKRYVELVKCVFNKDVCSYTDKRSDVMQLYFNSKEIFLELLSLGLLRGNKKEQRSILMHDMPKPILDAYLAGIINADGSVSNRKSGGIINITTQSNLFATDIQKLCRSLGIIASISTVKRKGIQFWTKNVFYVLNITGVQNIQKVNSQRLLSYKKDAYDKIIKRVDNSDKLYHSEKIIETISSQLKHTDKQLLYRNNIKKSQLQTIGCSKANLKKAIEQIRKKGYKSKEITLLQNVLKNDVHFIQITKKTKRNQETTVYNLEIEKNNTYFANNIPVHNCCIDELDKMTTEDRSAMHEALEQQSVTVSKANIQATLMCETTVLAAANPKLGRFDPFEDMAKQIDLPPALINRFDLIFPFRDLPDVEKDEKLASFVLRMHKESDTQKPEIDTETLRKFIIYARQSCHPKITETANQRIIDYYVRMRNSSSTDGGMSAISISARQLEALVRLTEASAKIRLSTKATVKDAERAIQMLEYWLSQVGIDPETGRVDIDRIQTGFTTSQRSKVIGVREIIKELEESEGKIIPIEKIKDLASQKGMTEEKVEEALEKLKLNGDIFEPKRGFISRIM